MVHGENGSIVTTLAAIQGDGWAVIGADSYVIDNGHIWSTPKSSGKIFKQDGYIIALAGDWRPAQIFQHNTAYPKPPTKPTPQELDRFIAQEFVPTMQDALAEAKYVVDKENDFSILVAVCGVIYNIDADMGWARDRRGYYQGGTGGPYALGAMNAWQYPETIDAAKEIVKKALAIACQYDNGSGEPTIVYVQSNG